MMCPVEGCEKKVSYGRKTCEMHYYRMRRNGSYNLNERKNIGRKIDFRVTDSGCYEVISHKPYPNGYVVFTLNGRRTGMHRHVYEQCFGEIPEGMYVCHKCDNKKCINPEHLEVGTHAKNVRDAVIRKRYRAGELHPNSKLTNGKVKLIRSLIKKGYKNISIAKLTGAHKDTVSDIKRGKSWKNVVG